LKLLNNKALNLTNHMSAFLDYQTSDLSMSDIRNLLFSNQKGSDGTVGPELMLAAPQACASSSPSFELS
jgi:hypothetical protein